MEKIDSSVLVKMNRQMSMNRLDQLITMASIEQQRGSMEQQLQQFLRLQKKRDKKLHSLLSQLMERNEQLSQLLQQQLGQAQTHESKNEEPDDSKININALFDLVVLGEAKSIEIYLQNKNTESLSFYYIVDLFCHAIGDNLTSLVLWKYFSKHFNNDPIILAERVKRRKEETDEAEDEVNEVDTSKPKEDTSKPKETEHDKRLTELLSKLKHHGSLFDFAGLEYECPEDILWDLVSLGKTRDINEYLKRKQTDMEFYTTDFIIDLFSKADERNDYDTYSVLWSHFNTYFNDDPLILAESVQKRTAQRKINRKDEVKEKIKAEPEEIKPEEMKPEEIKTEQEEIKPKEETNNPPRIAVCNNPLPCNDEGNCLFQDTALMRKIQVVPFKSEFDSEIEGEKNVEDNEVEVDSEAVGDDEVDDVTETVENEVTETVDNEADEAEDDVNEVDEVDETVENEVDEVVDDEADEAEDDVNEVDKVVEDNVTETVDNEEYKVADNEAEDSEAVVEENEEPMTLEEKKKYESKLDDVEEEKNEDIADEVVKETEVKEAVVDEEAEELELFEIEIDGVIYFATDEENGDIYECINGEPGEQIGTIVNGEVGFFE